MADEEKNEAEEETQEIPEEEDSGELLSPEEIEALLDMVEESGFFDSSDSPSVERRDFKHPRISSRRGLQRLRHSLKDMARDLRRCLTDLLNLEVECEVTALEEVRFESHLERLGEAGLFYPWMTAEGQLLGFLEFGLGCASAVVDRVLGGSGKTRLEDHVPTPTELPLLRPLAVDVSEVLREALSEMLQPEFATAELAPAETTSRGIRQIPLELPTVCIEIALCGGISASNLRLVLMSSAMRNIGEKPPSDPAEETRRALNQVPLHLSVVLGEADLLLRDLIHLEVGDVIRMPTHVGDELPVIVEGKPRLLGQAGTHAGRLGIRITRVVEEKREEEKAAP